MLHLVVLAGIAEGLAAPKAGQHLQTFVEYLCPDFSIHHFADSVEPGVVFGRTDPDREDEPAIR